MVTEIHPQSKNGFSEATSDFYNKVRPSYPPDCLSYIRSSITGEGGLNVVEIGSGTGILTRGLLTHPEWASSISALKAIEPSEGMRKTFLESVKDSRVSLSNGTFDKTGVEDGWADVIVIAQAFHWCLDHQAAAIEFARILKPDGIVSFMWNKEDRDSAEWVHQLTDLVKEYDHGRKMDDNEQWKAFFDAPAYKLHFQPAEERTFTSLQHGTAESVTLRSLSWSPLAILKEDEKAKVTEQIKEVIRRGDGKKWIDENEGVLELPYKTIVFVMHQK